MSILGQLWRSFRFSSAKLPAPEPEPAEVPAPVVSPPESVANYWTEHNVSSHREFESASESLDYFAWRNDQYFNYIELMPVRGFDGQVVLDYGCGPGNDLVGLAEFSSPARLIGIDISSRSLEEAARRLALHGKHAELIHLEPDQLTLPLDDESVDYIHCSGVLHHSIRPREVLSEFRRVLRPDGSLRIMVYHRESLWFHLYCAYHIQIKAGRYPDLALDQLFGKMTDGENCPVSRAFRADEMVALAREAGIRLQLSGVAVSAFEMSMFDSRFDAVADPRLPSECRAFLNELTVDRQGLPLYRGVHAGVDGCYIGRRLDLA